jgi:transposase
MPSLGSGVATPSPLPGTAWLGEPLPGNVQQAKTPFAPRCIKDQVEERLFGRSRNLFSTLHLVFFDTASIYFEGRGSETLGCKGHSKDHGPVRNHILIGVVRDGDGHPVCCDLWTGNGADVRALIPVVDRLRQRFAIDEAKVQMEAGDDGKWVWCTNTGLHAAGVALKYKRLWMIEQLFRSTKSLLNTRPIFHKREETIRRHVLCSFLALVLRNALLRPIACQAPCAGRG